VTNPISATISLGGFVDFAAATASGRITAVHNVIDNEFGDYNPGHDFYRGIRLAIREGIANGDDVSRMQRAVQDCSPRRRASYESLATGWAGWRRRKDLEVFSQPLRWRDGALEVRVSPKFTWQQRHEKHLVWPYFKDPELSRDGVQAAIRLIEITFPESGCRPAVLDVRRQRIYQPARRRRGFDAWLSGEAAAFVSMLDSIRNVA
ncbi:hypothetical protein MAAFP003_2508, partial [Mycobacterium ahvazicum]